MSGGQPCRREMGTRSKKFHQSRSRLERGFGIVGGIEGDQQVGKAHDAQADLPGLFRHAVDVRKREAVAIDDIVEKTYGDGNGFGQSDEVDGGSCLLSCDEDGHIDGAEGAGFIGQKRLFTAGVGRFDSAKARGGVGPVDRV